MAAIGVLGLAWTTASSSGREHLVTPSAERDSGDEHEANVRIVLKEAFAPGVELRAIVEPSFQPEYAVGLRRANGRYELFSLVPSKQVWHYSLIAMMKSGQIQVVGPGAGDQAARDIARLKEGLPERPADLPVSRCAIEVDSAFAASLTRAWRVMLEDARPRIGPPTGLDGVTYQFAMDGEGRSLAGETWSPEPETRPGKLTAVADAIRTYCWSRDPAEARRILASAEALGAR